MRTRTMERDTLHGPWPSPPEILAAEYPDWEIWRDQDGHRHGPWYAKRGEYTLTAHTIQGLRERLEEVGS